MNTVNYNDRMEEIMAELSAAGNKPKLLLHACCAPCASACIERVKESFDLTVYFYNPNMDGAAEYKKRAAELERLCTETGVKYIIEEYDPREFTSAVKGLETCPEGGGRCAVCFKLRMERTAKKAAEAGFEYFTTTLTVSPHKNAELINQIGFAAQEYGAKFLPSDFKKRGGFLRSVKLSEQYGLYRQNYCGCEFSKNI